jgi:hypothetical protein
LRRLGVQRRRTSDTGRAGLISVPLFFGISSVTEKKRFDLHPVFRRGAASIGSFYLNRFRQAS